MQNDLPVVQQNTPAETLKEIKELVDKTYRLDKEAKAADKLFKASKASLLEIMQAAECDKIAGDDCNASVNFKNSVSCPKGDADKLALFKYLAAKDSEFEVTVDEFINTLSNYPTLLSMITISASSFSSWYDKEMEAKAAEGDYEFKLPMVTAYERYSLGLRKRAAKK